MEVVSHKTTDRLVEKLKKSLDKQGVPYTQIYYNGRYEYKKSTYIYGWTVEVGDKSRTVSWCEEAGWRWDTQMPPTMDPKQILRRKLLPLKEILRLKRELEEEEDG